MNWKKWIATAMLPVVIIWLSGFNQGSISYAQEQKTTEAEILELALEKLTSAESMRSSLVMDMDIEVFRLRTGIEASMDMVSFRSPMKIKSEMNLDMGLLGKTELEAYATEKDGNYQLFVKGADGWKAGEAAISEVQKYDGRELVKVYLEQVEELEVTGTKMLDGKKVYQFSGVVKNDGLKKVLLDTGCLQILATLFQDSILKSLGGFLAREEEVAKLLQLAEDMELTLFIDAQTGYPLQCTMDITEMMSDAYDLMTPKVTKGSGKSEKDIWSQIEVTKTQIVIKCSQFNTAEDFTIPKAARSAQSTQFARSAQGLLGVIGKN